MKKKTIRCGCGFERRYFLSDKRAFRRLIEHKQQCAGNDYEGLMHPRAWSIGGMQPDERLTMQVKQYSRLAEPPSREQIAAVLHALADYTSIQQAVQWIPDDGDGPAHAVCRWLHDYGDYMEVISTQKGTSKMSGQPVTDRTVRT